MNSSDFILAQWLFLQGLAFVYFCAFASLLIQVKGLFGSQGIAPIKHYLERVQEEYGKKLYYRVPTLFWWKSSDPFLVLTAGSGVVISLLILLGVYSPPLFLFLWFAYLSFYSVGTIFLGYQWDILLLEVGFIAIFFSMQIPSPILFVFLLWFLLFRFLFASGAVKLLSRCPEWRSLKALDYHYETQPLPNRFAYYVHQLPRKIAKLSTAAVFFLELGVTFLIFFPSPGREIAFLLIVLLQVCIALTGNYAFFNLLTVVMAFPLLDNQYLSWLLPDNLMQTTPHSLALEIVLSIVAGILLILNGNQFVMQIFQKNFLSFLLRPIYYSYNIVNSYGLFAAMTTERDEIVIEGSDDGKEWKAYGFKWKPGDLKQPPKQVAPHQPRLDWQMWFASLSDLRHNPWFIQFLFRLLEGSPDTLKLLKTNPFPDRPPKYIRSLLYRYHFSDLATKRLTGQWWIRTYVGIYSPPCTLNNASFG